MATPRGKNRNDDPRARGEERLDDIRRVVLELVAERGVEGVTIDAIAEAARASKATLYRRWSSKSALVQDAVQMSFAGDPPDDPGDLGSLRTELRIILDRAAYMLRTNRRLIIALIDGAQRDEMVWSIMRTETQDNLSGAMQRPLQRAIARGEIPPDTNINLIFEIALPVLLNRAIWNESIDDRYVDFLLDDVLMRLVTSPGPATVSAR